MQNFIILGQYNDFWDFNMGHLMNCMIFQPHVLSDTLHPSGVLTIRLQEGSSFGFKTLKNGLFLSYDTPLRLC